MGFFDFLSSKRVNKDIEKFEKRRKDSEKIQSIKNTVKKTQITGFVKPFRNDKEIFGFSLLDGYMSPNEMKSIKLWVEGLKAKQKFSVRTKREVREKVNIKLTKNQIKDRQIYASIKVFAELMEIDSNMSPNEMKLLKFISDNKIKKLSKNYNKNSDEFLFVWSEEENVFECLKTYSKRQVKEFFQTLFCIAAFDTELKPQELIFLKTLYCRINVVDESEGLKKITRMYNSWRKNIINTPFK